MELLFVAFRSTAEIDSRSGEKNDPPLMSGFLTPLFWGC